MRIIFFISSLNIGGAEMMLRKILNEFSRTKNIEVIVVSLTGQSFLSDEIKKSGFSVCQFNLKNGLQFLPSLFRIHRIIESFKPHILQGWMYHGNLLAYFFGKLTFRKAKIVWNIRQSLYEIRSEKILTRVIIYLGKFFSKDVNGIIYNSKTSISQHQNFGYSSSNTLYIPNGFDYNFFKPNQKAARDFRDTLNISNDTFLVGLLSRYHPMKGYSTFIEAAQLVIKKCDDITFICAGNNVDTNNHTLTSLIKNKSLDKNVLLLGQRKDTNVINAALDIAVNCSSWGEAFSNSLGEAMACGVTTVVTDIGDSKRVQGGHGITIQPNDPYLLAEAIIKLYHLKKHERQSIGENARKHIIAHYGIEIIASQYLNYYERFMPQTNNIPNN